MLSGDIEEYLPPIDGIRSELTCVAHGIALSERPPGSWIKYSQWIASQATTPPVCPITDGLDVYQRTASTIG
jgi:hypothetical protein